jgi:3-oxoacyl-[acyl-carrier protein] reductase
MINNKYDGISEQVAIITGTSRGLGFEIAQRLLQDSYVVYGCSRGPSKLEHPKYKHEQLDLLSETEINKWIKKIYKENKRIDVLICNAAIASPRPVLLTTTQQIEGIFKINFFSAVTLCRIAAKLMIGNQFGRIIAFSSIGVVMSDVGTSSYVASKSALESYFKVMGRELASFNITCNIIRIPIFESEMTKNLSHEVVKRVLDRITCKRFVTIAEVYHLIQMVLNSKGGYINGSVLSLGFET